jgi:hypothetical protein
MNTKFFWEFWTVVDDVEKVLARLRDRNLVRKWLEKLIYII